MRGLRCFESRIGDARVVTFPVLGDNYAYIVYCRKDAVAIDAGEAEPLQDFIEEKRLELKCVLSTHDHYDHMAGTAGLVSEFGCEAVGPPSVRDGDVIAVSSLAFRVISTPGHTLNGVCYYLEEQKAVFTGDTLFVAGCGRLLGGNAAQMWDSLRKLKALPDDTQVFCGHDYTVENLRFALEIEPKSAGVSRRLGDMIRLQQQGIPTVPSRIGREKEINPFFRSDDPEMKRALGMSGASDVEVFAELRKRKDAFG